MPISKESWVAILNVCSRRFGLSNLFSVVSEREKGRIEDKYISGVIIVKKTISLVIIALLLGLCVMGQVPQKTPLTSKEAPQPATAESPANRVPEMTAADVEAFLDGLVPQQIGHDDIGGATIAVVKDGKLLFAKG